MARRVGSASAPNTASRLACCISITTTLWNNVVIERDQARDVKPVGNPRRTARPVGYDGDGSVHDRGEADPREEHPVCGDRILAHIPRRPVADALGARLDGGEVRLQPAPVVDLDRDRPLDGQELELARGGASNGPLGRGPNAVAGPGR